MWGYVCEGKRNCRCMASSSFDSTLHKQSGRIYSTELTQMDHVCIMTDLLK